MSILSAEVTEVVIGHIKISGLMDSEGNYYVGVPQIADLTETSRNTASRDFKRLMGKDFKTSKLKTEFNKNGTVGIPIQEFEKLLAKLDRTGNIKAQQLRDELTGLSLHQLFSDAFGVKFEAEDRQRWLKTRQEGKDTRRTWTDAIKDYIFRHPELSENDKKWMYSNASDILNIALFGKKASQLRAERSCSYDTLRDTHDDKQLKQIEYRENYAMKLVDKFDAHPIDAIKESITFFE